MAIAIGGCLLTTDAAAINGERYLVCHEDEVSPRAASAPSSPEAPRRVEKRRAPAPLQPAPTPVIDVPVAEPIPGRAARAPLPVPDPPAARDRSANDYRCLGLERGAAGILRVLAAPPGAKFARHPGASYLEQNVLAAGDAQLAAARPYLRRELSRPIANPLDGPEEIARLHLKKAVIQALADLGDTASAPAVRAFLESREGEPYPLVWEDALASLGRLDPREAEAYAIAVLDRVGRSKGHDVGEANRTRKALSLVVTRSPATVEILARLSPDLGDDPAHPRDTETCRVLAARIRAGDDALRDAVRGELSGDIRTQRGAHCYSQLVAAAFPGQDAAEMDTLLLRHRYDELVRWVASLRAREKAGALARDDAEARRKLSAWLAARSKDRDLAGARDGGSPAKQKLALHLALSAGLGDAGAEKALYALVDDADDTGVAPWVGARAALDLELSGAADHAAKRLLFARKVHTDNLAHGDWTDRGNVVVTEHVDLVDRLAARGDPRFALGLLDRQVFARQAAYEHLARGKPSAACEVVVGAAGDAERKSIEDAFWALSVLGDACTSAMRRAARDVRLPSEVRGMALEHLAMVRDASIATELTPRPGKDELRQARGRARLIHASRE